MAEKSDRERLEVMLRQAAQQRQEEAERKRLGEQAAEQERQKRQAEAQQRLSELDEWAKATFNGANVGGTTVNVHSAKDSVFVMAALWQGQVAIAGLRYDAHKKAYELTKADKSVVSAGTTLVEAKEALMKYVAAIGSMEISKVSERLREAPLAFGRRRPW